MLLACWLCGCATLSWYGQAFRGQIELLSKREDIAELINDPATDHELAERLQFVLEVREFAETALHLPEGRSYRHYADLERDAAVWNVVATPALSMTPKTWCYPVAGCLSYRGYFRREAAEKHREQLAAEGMDAAVFPAVAYSTLGWFADPVLNTMLEYDDVRLAGLLFHELAHEKLFVRGDTAFNESYATFIEHEGTRRWLNERGEQEQLTRWQHNRMLEQAFIDLLMDTRQALVDLFESDLDEDTMAEQKARLFRELRREYDSFAREHDSRRFDRWFEQELNNAHLASVATYQAGVSAFERLLEDCHDSLPCVHERAAQLAGESSETRQHFLAGMD